MQFVRGVPSYKKFIKHALGVARLYKDILFDIWNKSYHFTLLLQIQYKYFLNIAFQNIVSINNRFVSKCQDKNCLVIYSFVTDYNWKNLVPVYSIT